MYIARFLTDSNKLFFAMVVFCYVTALLQHESASQTVYERECAGRQVKGVQTCRAVSGCYYQLAEVELMVSSPRLAY